MVIQPLLTMNNTFETLGFFLVQTFQSFMDPLKLLVKLWKFGEVESFRQELGVADLLDSCKKGEILTPYHELCIVNGSKSVFTVAEAMATEQKQMLILGNGVVIS